MKIVLIVVGVLLLLVGGVWILQGVGILPGSFMTGEMQWAVYGAIAALVGAALLFAGFRRKG
jgi:hypothetical protein